MLSAACPAKHANSQHPVTLMSRPPARKAPALSLSKMQNDAKVTSKISSSRRIISWRTPAFRVIVSSAGAVAARDASLASVSDNPAAPKAGIVLLPRFFFDARFTALPALKPVISVCLAIVRPCASSRNWGAQAVASSGAGGPQSEGVRRGVRRANKNWTSDDE